MQDFIFQLIVRPNCDAGECCAFSFKFWESKEFQYPRYARTEYMPWRDWNPFEKRRGRHEFLPLFPLTSGNSWALRSQVYSRSSYPCLYGTWNPCSSPQFSSILLQVCRILNDLPLKHGPQTSIPLACPCTADALHPTMPRFSLSPISQCFASPFMSQHLPTFRTPPSWRLTLLLLSPGLEVTNSWEVHTWVKLLQMSWLDA